MTPNENELSAQIAGLRSDVRHIQSDIGEIKTDIRDIRGGIDGKTRSEERRVGKECA